MAEVTVKQKICSKCGVDVRPNTQFCYNCGNALITENIEFANGSYPTVRDKLLEEDQTLTENVAKPHREKMKSAASLKKSAKSAEVKQVKVVWEEQDDSPNLWFLIVTILLTLFALGVLMAMLRFR